MTNYHMVGSQGNPLLEWGYDISRLSIVSEKRKAASWGPDSGQMDQYEKHLHNIGVADPTGASVLFARARELNREALALRVEAPRADVAAMLASGEMSPAEARKLVIKMGNPRDAAETLRTQKAALNVGARRALLQGLQTIADFGEEAWLSLLKPIADAAIERGDDRMFASAHNFAMLLRDPSPRVKVFGLSALTMNRADLPRWLYQYGRPHLVYRWVVARNRRLREAYRRVDDDARFRVGYELRDVTWPRLADYAPEWGASLYSAQETLANIKSSMAEQEREFAALRPQESAPARKPPTTVSA